jgi:hypothetical protein
LTSAIHPKLRHAALLLSSLAAGSTLAQTLPALSETVLETGNGATVGFTAVADLNHDGLDDIVALTNNSSNPAVVVFLGNADGTFSAPVTYPGPFGTAGGLAIADMNLDGTPDIVFGTSQAVGIMYGDGAGGFAPTALIQYPPEFGTVTALVAASRDTATLPGACLSQGRCGRQAAVAVTGTNISPEGPVLLEWSAAPGEPLPASPLIEPFFGDAVALAMNRTGSWTPPGSSNGTDLLVLGQFSGYTFESLFNATPVSPSQFLGSNAFSALGADLNGDGLTDLVTSDGNLHVSLQGPQGLGLFAAIPPATFIPDGNINLVGAGDLDGDGKIDLVGSSISFASGQPALAVLRGDGAGGFASQEYYSNSWSTQFSFPPGPVGVGKVGSLGFVALPRGSQVAVAWYTKGGFTVSAGADQTVVAPGDTANIPLVGAVYPQGAATSYCWTLDGNTCFATTQATALSAPLGVTVATFRATSPTGQVFSSSVTLTVLSSLSALVGPPGPAGQNGAPGQPGADGAPGPIGPEGAAGPQGAPGPMGPEGPAGPQGIAGPQGAQGVAGEKGLVWTGPFDAAAAYQADDAVSYQGSSYIALRSASGIAPGTDSGTFWGVLAAAGEMGPAGVPGPQGPTGATGPMGPAGADGSVGPAGPAGATGPAGPQGPAGPTGPAGAAGATGPQGPAGIVVDQGWSAYAMVPVTTTTVLSDFTPSGNISLTRIQAHIVPAPSSCPTPLRVQVSDGTSSSVLPITSASNDSGALSVQFNAGTPLHLSLLPPSGCSIKTSQLNMTVQYRAR